MRRYVLVDTENGTVYPDVTNLSRFARIYRLNYGALKDTVNGVRASVRGRFDEQWVGYTYDTTEEVPEGAD